MPAAKQFSGHPPIRVLPDGRKQIVRETPVIFPSTGVALVDTELFLAWGTPDTEFTSLRLVDQDIRRGGDQDGEKSVLVQTFTEIPAYDATPTSEIQVGRDRYEKDANNRRVLIREFIQLSAATFTAGAAGTILTISPDKFALETVSSSDNGAIRTISRRYVEVGDTYAQVGPDVLERTASGLLRVRRLYVAKVGAAALSLEIGVTAGPSSTVLAAISDEGSTLAVARLQLTYLEPGQLSQSDDYSDNGALHVRTVTTFNQVPGTQTASGVTMVLVATQASEVEGIPTRAYRFAKGVGEVSRETDLANNGLLERVTIRHLTAPAGSDPLTTLAGYVRISVGKAEADGHLVWTATFAKGAGVVSLDTETKFNGALVITTKTELTAPGATAPTALTGEFSRDKREQDGHVVYVLRGAVGTGVVEDNTQTRYGGKLSLRTVASIGTATRAAGEIEFTADARDGYTFFTSRGVSGSGRFSTDSTTTQGGAVTRTTIRFINTDDTAKPAGALTATGVDQEQGYAIYTEVYTSVPTAGGGAGGYASEDISYRFGGALKYTTRTAYNATAPTPAGTQVLVKTETSNGDGFTINTRTWVEVVTVDLAPETQARLGGALTITTKRRFGSAPSAPAGGALISSRVDEGEGYALYTSVFASGTGNIDSESSLRLNGALRYTTYRSLNTPPTGTAGTLVRSETSDGEGYTLYTYTYCEVVSAELADETSSRLGGALTITTKRKINVAPTAPGSSALISARVDEGEGYTLFTRSYASGSGEIDSEFSERLNGALRYTTYRYLNAVPGTPPAGTLVRSETNDGEGFTLFTQTYCTVIGTGELADETSSKLGGALTITTKRRFGSAPSAPAGGALISSRVDEGEGYALFTSVFASGTGNIDSENSLRLNGALRYTTYRSLNTAPTGTAGTLVRSETSDGEGFTLFTQTYCEVIGTGELADETSSRLGGALTITTKRKINVAPTAPGSSALINARVDEGEGYTLFTRSYASGSGEIDSEFSERLNGAIRYTTYRYLNVVPGTPPAGTLVRSETNDGEGFTLFTQTYCEVIGTGELADETSSRLGGALTITTKRKINSAPTAPGSSALISARVDEGEGYTLFTRSYASGAGNIDSEESLRLNGAVKYKTYRSLNAAPTGTAGTLVRSEVNDGEGFTLYTYTYCEIITADLADETQTRLGGTLTITTKRKIGSAPTAPAGAALISARVDEGEGYTLFTRSYAGGSGNIDSETSLRMGGALRYTTYRSLNAAPTGTAGTLVRSETSDGDGYTLFTYTYCEIVTVSLADETQTRLGGALTITTRRSLGVAPSAPAGGVLIAARVDEGEGYVLFTRTYASGSGNIDSEVSLRMGGALRYTAYRSLNAAPTGTAGTLVRSETSDGEGYTLYTYTYCEIVTADLADETQTRFAGALTITTKRKIGGAPTAPAGAALISARVDEGEGYTLFTRSYAGGTGNIDFETSLRMGGALRYTTYRSLNAAPTGMAGTLVRSETSDGDGYTLYTYTYCEIVTADLADETSSKLDGKLTLTTKRKLGTAPASPGAGYAQVSARVDEGEGYVLHTVVFASGTGAINADEVRYRYNGRLTITTKRSLNVAPTAPGGTYVTLISTEISQGDGYAVYTYTWVSGSGLIDETTDTRTDGSQVHVITRLNDPTTGGTVPVGSYLANRDAEPGDGFIIYTLQYYTPPIGYTVPGVRVVTKPGVMTVTSSGGVVPTRQPEIVAITTSIAVTFTATPTVGSYTPIKGGGIAYERVNFASGEKLRSTTAFSSDFYSSGEVISGNGDYRGEANASYVCSVVGAADQSGSVVTFGYDAVPFFRSAGVTIFKQTVETGTL